MADQFFERRPPPGQFPSKFSALPGIGGSAPSSPVPGSNNQIVPYNGMRGSVSAGEAFAESERYRQLETRVNVSERSNRALLEEVVRLQSDLKATSRRNEDVIREERQARQQMENSLRSSNDLIAQLSSRLKRAEDKVQDERSSLTSLMSQTKTVEQAVMSSQQELMSRRDLHGAKIDEIKADLDETVRAKDSLERVTYQLLDEIRQVKSKVDSQSLDFSAVANDLKHKSKKLEDENRQTLEQLRKQNETHSQSEQTTQQLRSQVEIRLSELRDVIVDLRTKQDTETQERRLLEQQMQMKMADMQASLADQNRKREEAVHAMDNLQREREHAADTERIKMQSKIAEIAEQVSKKQLQKDMKMREETTQKFSQIEQALVREQEARQKYEREAREEMEHRFDNLKKVGDEEVQTLKEQIKVDKRKNTETLHNLNKAVNLIEKQNEESKRQQEKLMSAEIKARKQQERGTLEKVEDLQEKLHVATSTLQHAIGGMSTQVSSQADKLEEIIDEVKKQVQDLEQNSTAPEEVDEIRRELKELIEDNKSAETRQLADLDARILSLSNRLSQSEDMLEAKISTAAAIQSQNIREKVESIAIWQGVTQQTIRELQAQNQQLPQDIFALEEKHKLLKSDIDARVGSEAESRMQDVENLKADIERLKAKSVDGAGGASAKDIEACQNSIRKLAESIQTVKTVLGMKIQSEQKLRVEEIESLQDELDRLKDVITPLLQDRPKPRLFVKPDDIMITNEAAENQAPEINKWNLYTAYRWRKWRKRLVAMVPNRPDSSPSSSSSSASSSSEESSESEDDESSGTGSRPKSEDSDSDDPQSSDDERKKKKRKPEKSRKNQDSDSD